MPNLLEKLQALAETEKKATPSGKCVVQPQLRNGQIEVTNASLRHICWAKTPEMAALIADSRTLLKALLASWFAQHEALEKIRSVYGDGFEVDNIARKALNLATTPHP